MRQSAGGRAAWARWSLAEAIRLAGHVAAVGRFPMILWRHRASGEDPATERRKGGMGSEGWALAAGSPPRAWRPGRRQPAQQRQMAGLAMRATARRWRGLGVGVRLGFGRWAGRLRQQEKVPQVAQRFAARGMP